LFSGFSRVCHRLEAEVLRLFIDGLSYQEMAGETGKSKKSIDKLCSASEKNWARN
jgi:DNA-binding CsgD family transcriptional regulator